MKEPTRLCCACRERKPKSDLLRIVRYMDGSLAVDIKQREAGRGAYICKCKNCIDIAKKRHAIERSLKVDATDNIYEEIKRIEV